MTQHSCLLALLLCSKTQQPKPQAQASMSEQQSQG